MSSTFLQTFREYLRTRTDAPEEFHLHAGLCTLGDTARQQIIEALGARPAAAQRANGSVFGDLDV